MRTTLDPPLLRAQAVRYDLAIQALSEIMRMRLDEIGQMKQATAIVERMAPDLKFAGPKRLVLVSDDTEFMGALREACPDRTAASARAKAVRAEPNRLLQLRGAGRLALLLRQSIQADALVVAGIARRLREAARTISLPSTQRTAPTHYTALETDRPFGGFSGDAHSLLGVLLVPMVDSIIFGLTALDGPFGVALGECVIMSMCMKKLLEQWAACLAKGRRIPPANREAEKEQAALEARYAADLLDMPLICANFAISVGTGRTTITPSAYPTFNCYGLPSTFVPVDPAY